MNRTLRANRSPSRPDALLAAFSVLVALGWIMSRAPAESGLYMADSPPAQAALAPGASLMPAGTGLAALIGAIR
jgi:hypothetical protein